MSRQLSLLPLLGRIWHARSIFSRSEVSHRCRIPAHWQHLGVLVTASAGAQTNRLIPSFQQVTRSFSNTVTSRYPRTRGRVIFESAERNPVDRAQYFQERLARAAVTVAETDDHYKKELGANKSSTEYIQHVIIRLQPILQYGAYHPDAQFLKAHAPAGSPINRAREASVYLFVSAEGWLSLAVTAARSRSENLDPEISKAAERFGKVITMIEAYLEHKSLEDVSWSNVGDAILSASRDAWAPMYKVIGSTDSAELGGTTKPEVGGTSDKDASSQSSP